MNKRELNFSGFVEEYTNIRIIAGSYRVSIEFSDGTLMEETTIEIKSSTSIDELIKMLGYTKAVYKLNLNDKLFT